MPKRVIEGSSWERSELEQGKDLMSKSKIPKKSVGRPNPNNPAPSLEGGRSQLVGLAQAEVWRILQGAFSNLDGLRQTILIAHFDGARIQDLAKKYEISEVEAQNWINSIKHDLQNALRKKEPIKN